MKQIDFRKWSLMDLVYPIVCLRFYWILDRFTNESVEEVGDTVIV